MVRHAAQVWGPAAQCKAQCNHPGQVDSPLCVSVSFSVGNRRSDHPGLL